MSGPVYRKTDAGSDEVASRRLGLDPRCRSLLILCNGQADAATLAGRLGPQVPQLLARLLALGLVEAMPPPSPPGAARVAAPLPGADMLRPLSARLGAAAGLGTSTGTSPGMAAGPAPAVPSLPGAADTLRRAWRVLPRLGEMLAQERAERAARTAAEPALDFSVAEADLAAVRQRGMAMVEALWGPGGGDRVGPVRRAATPEALARALRDLYQAAAVFQGRRRADALMRQVLTGE